MVRRLLPGRVPARLAALAAAGAALAAGTGVLQWQIHAGATVEAAREQSVQAARDTAAAVLSYTSGDVETGFAARAARLTGGFLQEYTTLMNTEVIPGAKKDDVTAVTQVPAAASVSAAADRAVALIFVDQSVARGQAPPERSAFSVRVSLDRVGGRWLVSGFEPV
jgi:Mce-associated membrane protein